MPPSTLERRIMFVEREFTDYTPKNDKVIFIGKGHGWWDAPKDSTGFDIWGINDLILQRGDVDLLFNMHRLEEYSPADMHCVYFASKMGIPIMMVEKYPDIASSIKFPLEDCLKEFGTDYISTAIPFMFAYAAMKGYKQIDCYGINMRGNDEKYKNARASVEFWIGMCMGKGIKVNMYGKYCDCLKAFDRRIYGYNHLQTIPQVINDRALFVTFGTGLDRKALDKFHILLSQQPNGKYHNNLRPIPVVNDPMNLTLFGNLEEMIVKQGDEKRFVGDVGFYNMLHVDTLINTEHSSKIIIFENDNREIVKEDWMKFVADNNINPWTDQKCEHWNGDKPSPYDAYFPKYKLPKGEAFDKFYNEYYMMAARAQYKFPGFIKYVPSSMLDMEEGQRELLKFIGYEDSEIVIPKEEACQQLSTEK